jgi:hypothetical protein
MVLRSSSRELEVWASLCLCPSSDCLPARSSRPAQGGRLDPGPPAQSAFGLDPLTARAECLVVEKRGRRERERETEVEKAVDGATDRGADDFDGA